MPKRGKIYKESAKLVDKTNLYEVSEAMDLITKTAKAKFDETIEIHIKAWCRRQTCGPTG